MRNFFIKNKNKTMFFVCILGLIYVNSGLPFRLKRVCLGSSFYEVMC